ncbi:hypothetical protein DNTS_004280 [Danionella cerebrum]|uniref:TRASH domain-containing protein n=1 Tax=Danionella cerebrum TaxID=2873325 RepID=A0A553RI57_9TELE|nr:hypothetical protein DNTS_004280 [Danionella translucida]
MSSGKSDRNQQGPSEDLGETDPNGPNLLMECTPADQDEEVYLKEGLDSEVESGPETICRVVQDEDGEEDSPEEGVEQMETGEAENILAREIKNEKSEASTLQTILAPKPPAVQLSPPLLVKVKDEPMDEEYDKVPEKEIKVEPDVGAAADCYQAPATLKISSVFSVGENSSVGIGTSAPAPTKPPVAEDNSSDAKQVLRAPVDQSGTLKEFCSEDCLKSLTTHCSACQKSAKTWSHVVNFNGSIHKLCSDDCFSRFRSSNKLKMNSCVTCGATCSDTDAQWPSLKIGDLVLKFCQLNCLTIYQKKNLKSVACKACSTSRPVAEMIQSLNTEGNRELFCSPSCVTANKVQAVGSSGVPGVPVECVSCKKKLVPQFHLAMSDGTIQNFCSFSCTVRMNRVKNCQLKDEKKLKTKGRGSLDFRVNQEDNIIVRWYDNKAVNLLSSFVGVEPLGNETLSKMKPNFQVNMVTSTTNSTSTPKATAPKPVQSESRRPTVSKGHLQNVTKIPCSLCQQSFSHKPELVDYKCLMFFCSLQGTTGHARSPNNPLQIKGTSIAQTSSPNTLNNVISSSKDLSNGQLLIKDGIQTQTDGPTPLVHPPRILKNKALLCKPMSQNKGTSCKPNTCDMETQTEGPSVMVVPVPVPVYVPVPMNLYTQFTPKSVGLPLPIPVPLFFPTTLDSAESIVQTIQEIKEKIPDDPLEADLILMAEMVAEDAEKERVTSTNQAENIMVKLGLEDLSTDLAWEEDPGSPGQSWNQSPEHETPLPSSPAQKPHMDFEADFQIESNHGGQMHTCSGKRKSRRRGHKGPPRKKLASKNVEKLESSTPNSFFNLQYEYGVNAWKKWVCWRNSQPNMETPKFGMRTMVPKEDLLKCCTAEISYGLFKFVSEARRPNGEKYSPDAIYYLCLGIQKYLFENNRMENIFTDVFYTKFCQELTNILKGWEPDVISSGLVYSRVEEEHLWDSRQLGAFSPGVLLNTLLYFFTKYFNFKTVEQHQRLSFGHIVRCSKNQGSSKVPCLHFYPPKVDKDGVTEKKTMDESDDDEDEGKYEIKENADNPLRCPVRLYEFYLSKCSPSVKQRTTDLYLTPERSCVPSSPMWFSSSSLTSETLDRMLTRILVVRELHLMETERPPDDFGSDSDSD